MAAAPSPSAPLIAKLWAACGAFTVKMKSRSIAACICSSVITAFSVDEANVTAWDGHSNWASRRLPKTSTRSEKWFSTARDDSGTWCGA